ncbi:haloacid dehalogenase superfamily protein, subfamily IA, variant 3 with third motif having DD or ED [Belliella baltica DSM 15883]|uniref:Haloacid dehalogenase superfamily protein, subfamily IA, variant 3 with third motif having DD or ED n=1 Tax=Belliella baltica (strain DSM 15883 / CIP 108006 / LMG 21964 / BA134) TaxID=866536 RepID=I3Z0X2_BELBD|nr:HAD family phosphatase [Belliella baltica]AFL82890.1 haloacid dehalogenase superfamily protein, subfamily IA, variant 3 with third motif having DD or ED [Belliella baltica DSM 15883]
MQKAIIFDMDGVICHTNPFHSQAFKSFFAKRNMYPTESEFADHMYGKSNSYIMSHFFGREIVGEELLQLEDEKESLFREIYAKQVNPIGGFMEFLNQLKSNKLLTGVATSAPLANLELIAGKLSLLDKMESVLASEHVSKHKPDPEVYLKSAENLGVLPENCIVFEDSFSGVSAALNAGMKVVGVLSSHTKEELPPCDLYIENYLDLNLKEVTSLF